MAAGKISELVDDSAIQQLEALYQKLGITTQAMVAGTDAAAGYIAAISKVNTIAEFNAANQQAAAGIERVTAVREQALVIQKKIAIDTEALIDATLQKEVAAANKTIEANQKQMDAYLRNVSKQGAALEAQMQKEVDLANRNSQKLIDIEERKQAKLAQMKARTSFDTTNSGVSKENIQLTKEEEKAIEAKNQALMEERVAIISIANAQSEQNATTAKSTISIKESTDSMYNNIAALIEDKLALAGVNAQIKANEGDIVALTKEQFELNASIAQNTLFIKQQAKERLAEETSNDIYMAQLNQMIKLQNAMSVEERENTVYGRELQAQITATSNAVVAANEAQGKFNDNVGNYPGKAEPAITAVEKTGKSFDVTGRLAGVLTSRIFRMAASFLLITVALGAITWLAEWISKLDIFTGRLDETIQKLKTLQAALASSEYTTAIKNVAELTENIKLAKEGFLDKTKVLNEYNKTLGSAIGYTDNLDDAEQNIVKHGEAYIKMTLLKAAAQLSLQASAKAMYEAEQEAQKPATDFNSLTTFAAGNSSAPGNVPGNDPIQARKDKLASEKALQAERVADKKKESDLQLGIFKKFQQDAAVIAKANGIDFFDGTADEKGGKPKKDKTNDDDIANAKAHLELVKATAKETLDSENSSYEQRLTALKIFVDASNKLIDNERVAKNKKPGTTTKEKDTNNTEAKTQGLGVSEFDASERLKIQRQAAREFRELMKALDTDVTDDLKESLNQQEIAIEADSAKKISILTSEYAGKKITEQNYNREVKLINDRANEAKIQAEIDTYKQILAVQEAFQVASALTGLSIGTASPKDIQGTKTKIATSQIALSKAQTTTKTDQGKDDNKDQKEKTKEVLDFSQQAVNALTTVEDLINQNAQAKIDALQKQSDLINRNAQAEKDGIDNSILSSKEKARQQKIVDAQTRQSQLEIANQERKIKRDAAKFDKAANIAKVIEGTAVAIVSALSIPIYGEALAIVIGAIGAAQLAVVASQPLPAFRHGGTVAKDGYIQTGEAGTELRIDPTGAMSLTADKTNITYAKAGTKIISNKELMNIVGKPEPVYYASNTAVDTRKMEKLLQENNKLQRERKNNITVRVGDRFGPYSQNRNY